MKCCRHCVTSVLLGFNCIWCLLPGLHLNEHDLWPFVCCVYQKGAGYHLDLFWVAVLLIVCSFMGLPWYVAATVISIAHIDSLKMETETSAPGEQPKFLGVRYDLYVCTINFFFCIWIHIKKKQ